MYRMWYIRKCIDCEDEECLKNIEEKTNKYIKLNINEENENNDNIIYNLKIKYIKNSISFAQEDDVDQIWNINRLLIIWFE